MGKVQAKRCLRLGMIFKFYPVLSFIPIDLCHPWVRNVLFFEEKH